MKALFIHKPKTAGTYLVSAIKVRGKFTFFDSWSSGRDWNKEESKQIANLKLDNNHHLMFRSHQVNINDETFSEFKNNQWFSYTFLRDPLDVLCSLYFFYGGGFFYGEGKADGFDLRKMSIWDSEIVNLCQEITLDDFINLCLGGDFEFDGEWNSVHLTNFRAIWELPSYFEEIDFVGLPTEFYFNKLFEKLSLTYQPTERKNESSNNGFKYYYDKGSIKEKTYTLLTQDKEIIRQMDIVKNLENAER